MSVFDTSTEQGRKAVARLETAPIIWLTTVSRGGQPQSSPVWFVWDGETFTHYSASDQKVKNITRHPKVSLHLSDNGTGGDIVTIEGTAQIVDGGPPATRHAAYLDKYREGIRGIGMTPESFAAGYPVCIRVTPTRARVW